MPGPWDKVQHPRQTTEHFLTYHVFRLNFYRLHMLYFVITIGLFSVIVYYGGGSLTDSSAPNGTKLGYIDALFLCCSAMTTTGLNTVNLGDLSSLQQSMLCILMLIGNVVFLSTFVVVIRRHYFRRKLADIVQNSRSGRGVLRDIESEERSQSGSSNRSLRLDNTSAEQSSRPGTGNTLRRRLLPNQRTVHTSHRPSSHDPKYHHESGFGWFPAPWEIVSVREAFHNPFRILSAWGKGNHSYLPFQVTLDERGRISKLNEHERAELGGAEYRALGVLLWLLAVYYIFWLVVGTTFLVPYSYRASVVDILHSSQPNNLNPGWFGFFVTVTSFVNGGLNVFNANFVPFQSYYLILTICGALGLAGNTQFPILLRLLIWSLSKLSPTESEFHNSLRFLLHHPRRCFLYLFPSKETWYLLAIQLTIDITVWILFEILNLGLPAVMAIPTHVRVFDGLFQATGLRTSGSYIISMSSLAPALLIAYIVTMYISNFPIVMALRQTNTYEERSIGLDKGQTGGGLGMHIQRQLAYDIWFQLLAWFLVCTIERGKIVAEQPGFNAFNVLFEVVSAYGCVGLSTGVPDDNYSLSGAFQTGSKIVLLTVMLRGRHRGLPLAIDRSILLPGEDLMHRMDQHYNEDGVLDRQDEARIRRDEDLSGREDDGQGAEQDPERGFHETDTRDGDGDSGSKQSGQSQKGKNTAEFQPS